ncbi:MAG: hypothetical protein PVG90_00435 [Bacillota bacterium]
MKFYRLTTEANDYKNLVPLNSIDVDVINNINLKTVASSWKPIEFKFIGKGKRGDCPTLVLHLPVFSENAINMLNDLIVDNVEYLPINCPGKVKYWCVNVLKSIDCINFEKSKVIRFSSGRIMAFDKYVFKNDDLFKNVNIFKIPDLKNSDVFVSENFVEKVKKADLEGFEFVEI